MNNAVVIADRVEDLAAFAFLQRHDLALGLRIDG
jgi:hypothetical protein